MRPLDDLFVVDLSRILSGPVCTMIMADMGAEIIKIEGPPLGDDSRQWGPPFVGGISTYFHSINRNKKSLGLNLRTEAGREILWRLIERADVLVENFRPGVLDRLGFSYAEVSRRASRVIYCSISGFGQTGPDRSRPGYDVIAQGESGLMDLTGYPGQPPAKVGASIADVVAGLYALNGILLALLARHRTGKGQWVDIGLLDSTVSLLTYQALTYLTTGRSPERIGGRHPSIVPYECFEASDGYVNVGVTNARQWQNFCDALGLSQLAADPRFEKMKDRLAHYDELRPRIAEIIARMTRADVLRKMSAAGIPAGPINTVGEILESPHIRAREMVRELTHPEYGPIRMLGIPIKLSETPGSLDSAPPRFGEHNLEVLRKLGYTEEAVEKLAREQVIAS
jgi:crotonobetainyl-CoA:carnitine CoA-transferase CaiB-like acyl-CoA transferase